MKRRLTALALGVAAVCFTLPLAAMPIGIRTATWGVAGANGRAVVAAALPETDDTAEIAETLSAFADNAVSERIADDAGEYADFREWALDSGARIDALTNSPAAWLSFATCSALLAALPKEGDLVIDEVSSIGEGGEVEFVFSLDGVTVGSNAIEERLKDAFGVEGAQTPDETAFSSGNLTLSLAPSGNGRVVATMTPAKDANGDAPSSFFMRVKVK